MLARLKCLRPDEFSKIRFRPADVTGLEGSSHASRGVPTKHGHAAHRWR
jgi:hypothetical protein